jgi:hypothetical protein
MNEKKKIIHKQKYCKENRREKKLCRLMVRCVNGKSVQIRRKYFLMRKKLVIIKNAFNVPSMNIDSVW